MQNYGYQGYGYQPYGVPNYPQRAYNYQPQQMAQPQMQPQQQPQMQYEIPVQDVRFVTSEEAKAYIVMPNSRALLIDRQGGMAHLKSADNMGQSQTDYFRFERVNADGTPIKPQEPAPQINLDDYIKRQDLENFGFVTIDQYNALAEKLNQIQKQLSGGKQNVGTNKQPEARM
jgi:hypothetical protein